MLCEDLRFRRCTRGEYPDSQRYNVSADVLNYIPVRLEEMVSQNERSFLCFSTISDILIVYILVMNKGNLPDTKHIQVDCNMEETLLALPVLADETLNMVAIRRLVWQKKISLRKY